MNDIKSYFIPELIHLISEYCDDDSYLKSYFYVTNLSNDGFTKLIRKDISYEQMFTMIDVILEMKNKHLENIFYNKYKSIYEKLFIECCTDICNFTPEHNMTYDEFKKDMHVSILTYLIENDVDIDVHNEYGDTMIILACVKKNIHMLKFLLENGADTESKNEHERTAYYNVCMTYAVEYWYSDKLHEDDVKIYHEMIRILMSYKCNVYEYCSSPGYSMLYKACRYFDYDLIDILLEGRCYNNIYLEMASEKATGMGDDHISDHIYSYINK